MNPAKENREKKKRSTPRKLALSAGIVPVLYEGKSPLYLLLRVYNYWDFPKGIVERGEDPLEAARRELEEETGLARVEFKWGEEAIETAPYSYGKIARYYLGEIFSRDVVFSINPHIGKAEHHEFAFLSYENARERLVPRVQAILDRAHQKQRLP